MPAVQRKGGQEKRYDSIPAMNRLLFIAAFIGEKPAYACTLTDQERIMNEIISLCEETENSLSSGLPGCFKAALMESLKA